MIGYPLDLDFSHPFASRLVAAWGPPRHAFSPRGKEIWRRAANGHTFNTHNKMGAAELFDRTTPSALQLSAVRYVAPPVTIALVVFPFDTTNQNEVLSFGGSGAGNGFTVTFQVNQFYFTYGNVANYFFSPTLPGDASPQLLVIRLPANGGTAKGWSRSLNGGAISTGTVAVGTILAPTQPLTLGASHNNTTFNNGFTGYLGQGAIWRGALPDVWVDGLMRRGNLNDVFLWEDDIPAAANTAVSLELEGYRWRNDDGSETTATWAAAQDTTDSVAKNTNQRLRVIVNSIGNPPNGDYVLRFRRQGSNDPFQDVK